MASFARRSTFGMISSLCLSALAVAFLASNAHAISLVIDGGPLPAAPPYPGTGPLQSQNNVLNTANSGVDDGSNGANFLATTATQAGTVEVTGITTTHFGVNWWFAGAESGDKIQLTAVGTNGTIIHKENNENNNCCFGSTQPGPKFLGTTYQVGDGLINFSLKDLNTGQVVDNFMKTNNIPNVTKTSSVVFSYLDKPLVGDLVTTGLQTLWFLFAFNDNGSSDDNHDDYVGFAQVFGFNLPSGGTLPGVPLPPALVLFGSALVGLTLLGRRRRRRLV